MTALLIDLVARAETGPSSWLSEKQLADHRELLTREIAGIRRFLKLMPNDPDRKLWRKLAAAHKRHA